MTFDETVEALDRMSGLVVDVQFGTTFADGTHAFGGGCAGSLRHVSTDDATRRAALYEVGHGGCFVVDERWFRDYDHSTTPASAGIRFITGGNHVTVTPRGEEN